MDSSEGLMEKLADGTIRATLPLNSSSSPAEVTFKCSSDAVSNEAVLIFDQDTIQLEMITESCNLRHQVSTSSKKGK